MKTSNRGLDLIKKYEGLRLEPYICPAKIPTIGYGTTYYEDGTRVQIFDRPITKDRAEELLRNNLLKYEGHVNRMVKTDINQNQFDALVSFTYNLGGGALRSSTLLKLVNQDPNDQLIISQFLRWTKSGGKVLLGLARRRKEEADLYFSPCS